MKKLVFILPLIILFSCSVQKRKYKKGFYVSSHKTINHTKKDKSILTNKEPVSEKLISKNSLLPVEQTTFLEASVATNLQLLKPTKFPSLLQSKDGPCDAITLKNGEEISAKILEITPIEIKYKKCNMQDGPMYIVKKTDVFMIKYSNGSKEVFKDEPESRSTNSNPNSNSSNTNKPKTTHEAAIFSLVAGICGFLFFFGSIPAIILGDIALRKIKAEPDKYEGEDLAKIGKILGIVGLVLKIAFFILIIVAIGFI
ncbi:MAG: DUF4190 domain-containing protein [Bacteroidota bacterium]